MYTQSTITRNLQLKDKISRSTMNFDTRHYTRDICVNCKGWAFEKYPIIDILNHREAKKYTKLKCTFLFETPRTWSLNRFRVIFFALSFWTKSCWKLNGQFFFGFLIICPNFRTFSVVDGFPKYPFTSLIPDKQN